MEESCAALSTNVCGYDAATQAFVGMDGSSFADGYCADPLAFCTYQPAAVRWLFIVFQCAVPGICALLAAWPTYFYPLGRETHDLITQARASHSSIARRLLGSTLADQTFRGAAAPSDTLGGRP